MFCFCHIPWRGGRLFYVYPTLKTCLKHSVSELTWSAVVSQYNLLLTNGCVIICMSLGVGVARSELRVGCIQNFRGLFVAENYSAASPYLSGFKAGALTSSALQGVPAHRSDHSKVKRQRTVLCLR